MVDEDGDPSPHHATRTILAKKSVARNFRILYSRSEFSLLETGHFDIVVAKVGGETGQRASDAVTIPLEEGLGSGVGAGVRMDGAAKE